MAPFPFFRGGNRGSRELSRKSNAVPVRGPLGQPLAHPGFPRILFPFTSTIYLHSHLSKVSGSTDGGKRGVRVEKLFFESPICEASDLESSWGQGRSNTIPLPTFYRAHRPAWPQTDLFWVAGYPQNHPSCKRQVGPESSLYPTLQVGSP